MSSVSGIEGQYVLNEPVGMSSVLMKPLGHQQL